MVSRPRVFRHDALEDNDLGRSLMEELPPSWPPVGCASTPSLRRYLATPWARCGASFQVT